MIIVLEQKQIEEMSEDIARMLCEIYRPNCDEYEPHTCSKCYVNSTPIGCFVEILYNAGYRKQSEGVWIYNPDGIDWGLGAWQCSLCSCNNHNLPQDKDTNPLIWAGAKYCPNCGAKMKGGAE